MTFLQPFILWGLPLILLPVLIHLLNRMRHRPQPWAAMRFLVSATRSSVNNAKLRQWIILALRVLAVLMLILFLGRPLAGGWLGWALSPAPDAILILLDRSASMESTVPGSPNTKREQALETLVKAAEPFDESSHLILIDSASRTPQEMGRASVLKSLPQTAATETAADIPGLLASAVTWLLENRAGTAELWLASDLQKSSWHPEDPRWQSLAAQLLALPQRVRARLLALDQPASFNRSVSLKELIRRGRADQSELQVALDVQASALSPEKFPLSVTLDGAQRQEELSLDGQALRWRHKLPLSHQATNGWGLFALPADGNRLDNAAYFIYTPEPALRASIVGSESRGARVLQLAIRAGVKSGTATVDLLPAVNLGRSVWEDNTLLVWKEGLPTGATAQRIRGFAEEGGTVLFLPPGLPDAQRFEGLGWGDVQSAPVDQPFRIVRWNESEGPLAKSDEGLSLPLADATFPRRQNIVGQKSVLAAFEDGSPFLARQSLGRGEIYFCASLPEREWSNLENGPVLVPMMQRLLQSGGRRWQQASSVDCGELGAVDRARRWESVDSPTPKDIRTQAGVYRSGERLLAVNRPKAEDDPEILSGEVVKRLFGSLGLQMLQDRPGQADNLQGEIWRLFVCAMLLFLVVEGILILPARSRPGGVPSSSPSRLATGVPTEAKG